LWFLGLVLLAANLLEVGEGGTVRWRACPELPLPEVCAARRWLGWSCPLCGMTRSWLALLHGDLRQSWQWHRLGGWSLGVLVTTAVVSAGRRAFHGGSPGWGERFTWWCWMVTVVLLLVNRCAELCGL
jgi:hypothetical protein